MRNTLLVRLTTALAALQICIFTAAAEPQIAFVSMEKLFDEYHKTKTANQQLKLQFDKLDVKRREIVSQIKTMKGQIDELNLATGDKSLNDEARAKKKEALENKIARQRQAEEELHEFDNNIRKQFGEQMRQSQQQLVAEIRAVIQAYMRKRKIQIVFDSSGKNLNNVETVVCFDPSLDLTEEVLTILNKNATESESK